MSGRIKGLLTRGLNTLKEACQNVENQELLTDSSPPASEELLYAAQIQIQKALESISQRWEQTMKEAREQPDLNGKQSIINDYQHHWQTQKGDEIISNAQTLLRHIKAALESLPSVEPKLELQQTQEPIPPQPPQRRNNSNIGSLNVESVIQPSTLFPLLPETAYDAGRMNHNAQLSNQTPQTIRLPKFELPKFYGELEQFPHFWNVSNAAVHSNRSVPNTIKFLHLQSCLQGDAALTIHGLEITEECYDQAIQLLHQRYNRPRLTRNALVNRLKEIKPSSQSALSQRNTFCMVKAVMVQLDKLEDNSRSTATMQIIRDKFPELTRLKLEKRQHKQGTDWTMSQLLDALDAIIEQQEAVCEIRQTSDHTTTMVTQHTRHLPPQRDKRTNYERSPDERPRYYTKEQSSPMECCFCKSRNHHSKRCTRVTSVEDTAAIGVSNHAATTAAEITTNPCAYKIEETLQNEGATIETNHAFVQEEPKATRQENHHQDMFPPETDCSHRRTHKLEFKPCSVLAFGGKSTVEQSAKTSVTLVDVHGNKFNIKVTTRTFITTVCRNTITNSNRFPENIHGEKTMEASIDILLGIDYYWHIVNQTDTKVLPSGLNLMTTRLGPVTSGITRLVNITKKPSHIEEKTTGQLLSKLWDLETVGIHDDPSPSSETREGKDIIEHFYRTVVVAEGYIYVQFPWKANHQNLPDNKALARRRLENQYVRYKDQPEIWKAYCDTIEQQLKTGIIEEVDEHKFDGDHVYYLPHQVVTKDSETTKHRIVYDASSHYKGAPSLNDCIHQGPTLLPDLCGTLLRARLHRYLIVADVEKAFHQIRLQKSQRDATRFLWLKNPQRKPDDDNIRIFRFTRVPFGINASPFLLSISVRYGLEREKDNSIRKEILANTYVDNVLIGGRNTEECLRKQRECKETFNRMQMNLREFMSNNAQLMEQIPEKDRTKPRNTFKILGIQWSPSTDKLLMTTKIRHKTVDTKRRALRVLASTFDPLGFLNPLLVKAKIFLQDLWRSEYDWDTPLTEEDKDSWRTIVEEIDTNHITIPRYITSTTDNTRYDLLVFADASVRIYAAVVYLLYKSPKDGTKCDIVMSKSRLAPLEKITVPRLELMAMFIAAKLAKFVHNQMKIKLESILFFSDSQIALFWIHSKKDLKTFVKNRVQFIHNTVNDLRTNNTKVKFHFVNTNDNPADYATRGLTATEAAHHTWWNGPSFVLTPEEQ
ncbi:hypothetical protein Aduo_016164 [Ancylostoma duodenale]